MVTGCIQQGVSSPEQPMLLGDAFSVAGDRVVLARDHEGIIVLEPWQLLAKYYSPYDSLQLRFPRNSDYGSA